MSSIYFYSNSPASHRGESLHPFQGPILTVWVCAPSLVASLSVNTQRDLDHGRGGGGGATGEESYARLERPRGRARGVDGKPDEQFRKLKGCWCCGWFVAAEGVGSSEIEPCQELCTTRRQERDITAVSFDWGRETKPVQKPSR